MSDSGLSGTPEDVRLLLEAHGRDRDKLMRHLFGEWAGAASEPNAYQSSSGLILPNSARTVTNPLDRMRVYLTTDEIFGPGHTPSIAAIVDQVKRVSLEMAVGWCADWVAKLHHPNTTQQEVDTEFIETYLDGSHRRKIESLLREPQMVLLATQTFVVLSKIALQHCERRGEPPVNEDLRPLVTAALSLPGHLTTEVEGLADADLIVGAEGGVMGAYLVANQIFNRAPNWQAAWAVYQRCLRELPNELMDHPRVVDFEAAYVEATGVPLDDLVTICAVVWARAMGGSASFPLTYFEPLKWSPSRLDAVLDLISATPENLRDLLRDEAGTLGILWSTKTFDQFPIVRWNEHLTLLHPTWVVNRSTGLWPLLDVRRNLETRGESRRAATVSASVELTHEVFSLEVIEDLVGAQRMFRQDVLRHAYGRRSKVADAAIDYGSAWVVIEVTTAGFQLKTAAGISAESLEQDIDDIVRKARQVEATIDNIRRDEVSLAGRSAPVGIRRFHPVVVVAARFAGNPLTFTLLRERLKREGVLQGGDCAPLEVLQLDDLLAMEGANEKYGSGFLGLLSEKAADEGPLVPMIEFLADKFSTNAPLPERIDRSWKSWMETAIERLRVTDQASDDGEFE